MHYATFSGGLLQVRKSWVVGVIILLCRWDWASLRSKRFFAV